MPIYQTAHYEVRADAEVDDPTKFVHLFIFEDEAAHEAHSRSDAVAAFEAVYTPELTAGPVVFTDYDLVAATMR